MFGRRKETVVVTRVELSDETRQALTALDGDLQVLTSFVQEVIATQREIVTALTREILSTPPASPPSYSDVEAAPSVAEPPLREINPTVPPEDRVRDSPFTRRPRSEQVAWLLAILADGEWHTPIGIADEYANDERHRRYLRHAVGGRLREMHEDGEKVERRSSKVRGAMYEYRLRG